MRQNSKNNELRGVYDNVMLPNYSPANFVPKKAEGSLVWDQDDKEYSMERKYRDVWGWGIAGGTIDIQKINITSAMVGKRFNQRK